MDNEPLYLPDVVPVFPLPEVVLFPGTLLPLRIFEPRYRELVTDALSGERVLAIALLKPGFEPLYYTQRAPIHSTIGLGHIVESEKTEEPDFNVLIHGVGRAEIVEEVSDQPYRQARIDLIETSGDDSEEEDAELRQSLFSAIRDNPGLDSELRRHWLQLRTADLKLDQLADLLAAGLPSEAELRQCLLKESDPGRRTKLLLSQVQTLEALARARRRVVPADGCSLN